MTITKSIILEPATRDDVKKIISMTKRDDVADLFGNPKMEDYLEIKTITYGIKKLTDKNQKKLIGSISVTIMSQEASRVCLWGLYVKKEYRHQGIATTALNKFIAALVQSGVTYVYGVCDIANSIALEFYSRHFLFLKKDCKSFGVLKSDLSNISEYYTDGNELEVVFSSNYITGQTVE